MKKPTRTYKTIINGQEVEVKVYPGTKRRDKPWTKKR